MDSRRSPRSLIAGGELADFDEDLRTGASIELALRARLDDFTISRCRRSVCRKRTPQLRLQPCCGAEIEPTTYEQVDGMDREHPAGLMQPPKSKRIVRARR